MLPKASLDMTTKLHSRVSSCQNLSLTSDLWTAPQALDSFIGITAHLTSPDFQLSTAVLICEHFEDAHTAENITTVLKKCIQNYKIAKHKIFMCVTDNAGNISNGVEATGLVNLSCFLHTLHLVIIKALEVQPGVGTVINNCKAIVKLFKKSSVEKKLFHDIDLEEEVPTHRYRLHHAVVTRWGSTIKMLETFKRARARLTLWMSSSKQIDNPLNNNDWTKIENIIDVLKPLEHVRQIFSSRASNASEIIKYIMYLKVKYNRPEMNQQGIKSTSKALREQMESYFEKYLEDDNLILSNFLNPNNRLRLVL